MTDVELNHGAATEDLELLMATYQRLAAMDPHALRALAGDLQRMSDEGFASASLLEDAAVQARAGQDARRAAVARAALATLVTDSHAGEGG